MTSGKRLTAATRRTACACLLAVSLHVGQAAAQAEPLLRPAAQTLGAEKLRQLAEDPYVMRWREARMAFDAVFEPSAWDEPLR